MSHWEKGVKRKKGNGKGQKKKGNIVREEQRLRTNILKPHLKDVIFPYLSFLISFSSQFRMTSDKFLKRCLTQAE